MKRFRIALLPGDGIGPEVVTEAVRVLDAIEERDLGPALEYETLRVGAAEYVRSGDPLPPAVFERLPQFDAILLGAVGLPNVCWPNGVEMTPQLDLRERLDLYCGLRPVSLFHRLDSPLRTPGAIDFLLVRENTEGLFAGRSQPRRPGADTVEDTMRITRGGVERITRAAFRAAMTRRKHVTLVDKANVLPSMVFFRRVFDEVASEFPDVTTEKIYVDAATLYLLQRPQCFDVLVMENMFGDILSELAAGLVGGMGMAPSADIGDRYAVFQPSHGSAPDIACRGIANPVATILSAALMLEWLGAGVAAKSIRDAVRRVFEDPAQRTAEMGGALRTAEMTDAIIAALP